MRTDTAPAGELFTQAVRTFEAALQSGVKIQEESAKWFANMLGDLGSSEKWRKRTQAIMDEAVMVTRKNIEETIRAMNQNAQASLELLEKAFCLGQSESNVDVQSKSRDWWDAALSAMRTNTEAIIRANTRMLESWEDLAKKMNGDIAQRMVEQAEKMAAHGRQAAEQAASR